MEKSVVVGQAFKDEGDPDKTWDAAVAKVMEALHTAGHTGVSRRNKKKVRLGLGEATSSNLVLLKRGFDGRSWCPEIALPHVADN